MINPCNQNKCHQCFVTIFDFANVSTFFIKKSNFRHHNFLSDGSLELMMDDRKGKIGKSLTLQSIGFGRNWDNDENASVGERAGRVFMIRKLPELLKPEVYFHRIQFFQFPK